MNEILKQHEDRLAAKLQNAIEHYETMVLACDWNMSRAWLEQIEMIKEEAQELGLL